MDNSKRKINKKMQDFTSEPTKRSFKDFIGLGAGTEKEDFKHVDEVRVEEDDSASIEILDTIDEIIASQVVKEKEEEIVEIVIEKRSISTIAAGVTMEGTLQTEGDLECRGEFKGDIIASGNVAIFGKHAGNIEGYKVSFENATIVGDVVAKENILIDSKTTIEGNLTSENVTLDGQVHGDIHAEGVVCLHANAILTGNIEAASISIENGAKIFGQIKTKDSDN
ncbi:MAG: polymer-forming cytoskeletal protein [Longicatena sp.]